MHTDTHTHFWVMHSSLVNVQSRAEQIQSCSFLFIFRLIVLPSCAVSSSGVSTCIVTGVSLFFIQKSPRSLLAHWLDLFLSQMLHEINADTD